MVEDLVAGAILNTKTCCHILLAQIGLQCILIISCSKDASTMHRQSIIQCPDSFTIRNEMHVNVIMLQFDCSFITSLYKSYSWTTRTSRCCLSPRQDPIHVQMQSRSQTYKKMRKSAIKIRNVVVFLFFILNLERKKYRAVLWA